MNTPGYIVRVVATGSLMALLLVAMDGWGATNSGSQQAKASFGATVERQLPAPGYQEQKQVLLNLDNGELLPMPTNVWMAGSSFSPRPRHNWMAKTGADLLVHSSEVSSNLSLHLDDGWLSVPPGTNVTFGTITASEVNEFARRGVFQHLEISRPEKGESAILVFKTREGGLGVMEFLAFTAKPQPMLTVRYKLVRGKSSN